MQDILDLPSDLLDSVVINLPPLALQTLHNVSVAFIVFILVKFVVRVIVYVVCVIIYLLFYHNVCLSFAIIELQLLKKD